MGDRRIMAVYASPQGLLEAVEAVRGAGAEIVDICSPIPLPELEELLPRRASPVRWFTLAGCISGAAFGFWLQIYSVLSWPIPVGGKPIVSISAFIIIAFELAILFGALATFLGFLLASRPPWSSAAVIHAGCSQNEFALVAKSSDSQFDTVRELLREKGAHDVRLQGKD